MDGLLCYRSHLFKNIPYHPAQYFNGQPLEVLMSFFTPLEEEWMYMMNISNNALNTIISLMPRFSFAPCLFHTPRLPGLSCPVFICFKGRWFTLWAMQLGCLILYSLCPSPCPTRSLSSLQFSPSCTYCPFPPYFLYRFTIKTNSKEESRLDTPFTRQLRGRMYVREKRSWK